MHTQEETQQGLIPSLSIEGLLTARDGAVEAFRRARRDLHAAKEALAALGVDFPRIDDMARRHRRQGDELARANAQLAAYRRYGMHKVLKRIETAMDETWKEAQEEA